MFCKFGYYFFSSQYSDASLVSGNWTKTRRALPKHFLLCHVNFALDEFQIKLNVNSFDMDIIGTFHFKAFVLSTSNQILTKKQMCLTVYYICINVWGHHYPYTHTRNTHIRTCIFRKCLNRHEKVFFSST